MGSTRSKIGKDAMRRWLEQHLLVYVKPLDMNAEERAYVERALLRRDENMAQLCGMMGMAFHVMGFGIDPFLVPPYLDLTTLTHVTVLGMLGAWYIFFHKLGKPYRHYLWTVQVVTVAFYAAGLYLTLTRTGDMNDTVVASSSVLTMALFMLAMCPYHGRMVYFTAALYWFLAAAAYWPIDRAWPWLYVHGLVMFNALLFQQGLVRRQAYYAVQEFRSLRLAAENEKLKVEKDLAAAKEVHESLLPPPSSLHAGKLKAHILHRTHSRIGGDWMALREFPDGRLAVVVADATGKGIQAALVTHAVQSLWAESLGEPDFKPSEWLQRVNSAMVKMGARTLHTLTMGIIIIDKHEMRYWSAGHLPVYVSRMRNGQREVQAVHGQGNILGLWEQAKFTSGTLEIAPEDQLDILLGTDGLFHKGTLHTHEDISNIVDTLQTSPDHVYDLGQDDDQTLVWIHKEVA